MSHALEPQALEAAALAQAGGLKNFGDLSYRQALAVLCDSLNREAKLSDFGRGLLEHKFVELLVNRLRIEEFFRLHPEIDHEVIAPPIVIVGLPRTGTTLLQRVLSCDPNLYSMHWWESRYPVPFPGEDLKNPVERIERARGEVRVMVDAMPKLMAIHPMDADQADEEVMLMEHSFMAAFNAYAHVPGYMNWLHGSDEKPAYDYLQRVLKFLQWQKRQRGIVAQRWVLKAPHHLLRMALLLREFPGAQVIQTHRDPVDTIPSIASFIDTLWRIYSAEADATAAGREWNDLMARAFHHTMAVRDKNPAPFFDVRFIDTVKKPFEVVKAIYAHTGMTLTPEAERAMQAWMEINRRDKREAHDYHAADFGLSEAQLKRDFADYRQQYIEAA
ncbi:MAG: sulfotransferase [Nevskiaceae bacterium]|nr:MAG: sulfotransferase [Nevskiaceae bacterium]